MRPDALHRACRALAVPLLLVAGAAAADDTELFVTRTADDPGAARANVLFIIDTSGSMETEVATQAEWNPDVTFSGCYRTDALYFATGTEAPPCGSADYVLRDRNRCAASSDALRRRGQFTDESLGWNEDDERWDPLAQDAAFVECRDDRGLDGNRSAGEPYAANGPAGPWATDPGDEPSWNTTYTLFDGNWLNWRDNPPTVTRTRLQIVKSVVNALLEDLQRVNVGLMRFNREEGGAVVQAVTDIESSRAEMSSAVDALTASGFTPLSETLYEAAQYLRSGNVDFGNVGPQRSVAASRAGGSATATAYRSPIDEQCQKTFIILLTDGEPARDENAVARIEGLPGFSALLGSCDGSGDGACLDDLAEYLYRGDAIGSLAGTQNVVTYTVGFDITIPLLDATARRGGGRAYLADDTGSLTSVLTDVLAGIQDRSSAFVAPSIPVGAFNRSASVRDVFVSVFEPTGTAHWAGNLKKYRFAGEELLDSDGQPAVDPLTGFFRDDVTSFWSAEPDGGRIAEGGAASRLTGSADRRLYTDVAGEDLTSDDNAVSVDNITAGMLGVPEAERADLVRWIRGDDVADLDSDGDTTEPRRQMGDPFHVRPVTVSYGTSADSPETVVYLTTNDGLLHAIDAESGDEIWAYLPSRLLGLQRDLFVNGPSPLKRYGLDGEIRLVVRNLDGEPGFSGEDRAILVFGMGRGGRAVYAVDVTNREAPRLLWQISSEAEGFAALGQVWAPPVVVPLRIGSAPAVDKVILSGGYDDAQDGDGYRADAIGNAMYIVDLETGALDWSGGLPDRGHLLALPAMTNSIPAAPRVIDLSGDGLADRMYVGDTGGRLWRFDIINGNAAASLVEGGVLASLGAADLADPGPEDARRFYVTPDAVFVNCITGNYLAINIGSGFRGHPLDTRVEEGFFSVRDRVPFGIRTTASYLTRGPVPLGELTDITEFVEPENPSDVAVPADAAGWRLRLEQDDGEKVLSAATTFNNSIFFNSFSPAATVSACAGGLGVNRSYQVDACDGSPVNNLDGSAEDDPLTAEDRFSTLSQAGVAPEAVFLFPASLTKGPIRCVGLVCFPPDEGATPVRRTTWAPEQSR